MDNTPLLDDKLRPSSFASAQEDITPVSPKPTKSSQFTVGLVFLAFVSMRAIDRVINKRVQDRMVNYQLMYMNFLWPIGVQFMTVFICIFYVWNQRRIGNLKYDWTFFLPNSKLASRRGP